jgi:predicted Zn-dependent peptidase
MNLPWIQRTLDNGLRVVVHRDSSMPVVCINIAYHVGSKNEVPGRTGFAHLFEHLMFNGSVNVPRGDFDKYCEEVGGYNNAYTTEDKTNYYMMMPSHALERGLWLESDRLRGLSITREGLDVQRSVVLEEYRQRVDNQPYGSAETLLAELCFTVHPYSHPVLGSMQDIEAATLDDVLDFHRCYYHPGNATLTLAGDVPEEEAIRLADKYFGDISPGVSPRNDIVHEPALQHQRHNRMFEDVPLSAVFMGYRICAESDDDYVPLDCLAELLGGGEASRLYRSLVYEQQIASQIQVYAENREHPGVLLIMALANPGVGTDRLLESIDHEIDRLHAEPFDAASLEKVINRAEASMCFGAQSMSQRADRFTHYDLFYRDPGRVNTLIDQYRRVQAGDLARVGHEYLVNDRRAVILYEPKDEPAADAEPDGPGALECRP